MSCEDCKTLAMKFIARERGGVAGGGFWGTVKDRSLPQPFGSGVDGGEVLRSVNQCPDIRTRLCNFSGIPSLTE